MSSGSYEEEMRILPLPARDLIRGRPACEARGRVP